MLINDYLNNRNNNFNIIRFIAASLVLYAHSFPLLFGKDGIDPFKIFIGMHLGEVAVDIFFITSGFLIANSFFRKKSILSFVWARFLRIYPALFISVLFCIFLGFFFSNLDFRDYFFNYETVKFFLKNISLFFGVEYYLPNVFSENPYSSAINGSLWTLPWEVKMYLYLVVIGTLILFMKDIFHNDKLIKITFVSISLISTFLYILDHFYNILPHNFIRLFTFFFLGVMYYVLKDNIKLSKKILIVFIILLIFASFLNKDLFFILYILFLPYVILSLSYIPEGMIRQFNNYGDYSYGIYIYAFPIQQTIVFLIPNISISEMIAYSFIITLMFAILSWHLIESKCLKLKNIFFLTKEVNGYK